MAKLNKVAVFTKEYPPYVYGGAGVHVEYLCRELARLMPVEVRCFGDQDVREGNLTVKGYGAGTTGPEHRPALRRRRRRVRPQPGHVEGQPRRRYRPLPHLVHRHGRPAGRQAVGRALRADHPFARTAAPLEGRAVGQRLSPQRLDGAHGHRAGRRRDRRLAAKPATTCCASSTSPPEQSPRHLQRHRPRRVPEDRRHRCPGALRRRPGPALRALRGPHHPPEGDHPPGQRHPAHRPGVAGRALRRRARHPGDRARDGRAHRAR